METPLSFGHWVQQRRKALALTQAELAERIGCAVVTLKKIEQDVRRPSRALSELLADHLLIASKEREQFIRAARGAGSPPALAVTPRTAVPEPGALPSTTTPLTNAFVTRTANLPYYRRVLIGRWPARARSSLSRARRAVARVRC